MITWFGKFMRSVFLISVASVIFVSICLAMPVYADADNSKDTWLEHYNDLIAGNTSPSQPSMREYELINNGDFSQGAVSWNFPKYQPNCGIEQIDGKSMVVFRGSAGVYGQAWQYINAPIPAGRTVKFTVSAKVVQSGDRPAKMLLWFLGSDKTTKLYVPGEQGKALSLDKVNTDFKTYEITYTVPDGTAWLEPIVSLDDVGEVYIQSISLTIPLSESEADTLGLAEKHEYNIINNGDFSQGALSWNFPKYQPNCGIEQIDGKSMVVFRGSAGVYGQAWQYINASIPAGRTVKLTVSAKVVQSGDRPAKMLLWFLGSDKTTKLYVSGEQGKALSLDKINTDFKTYEITYTVPDGTAWLEPIVSLDDVGEVYIQSISLTVPLTRKEASTLRLLIPTTMLASPDKVVVKANRTQSVSAVVYDQNNEIIDGINVIWSSDNSNIAAVDGNGIVTGISPGQTVVRAVYDALSVTVPVTVEAKESAVVRGSEWIVPNELIPVLCQRTLSIDGMADDWSDIPFEGNTDRSIKGLIPPSDSSDASGRFKVAADNNNLYFLITVKDNMLVFGKNKNYNDDSVEIYLSPDFSQENTYKRDVQLTICPQDASLSKFIILGNKSRDIAPYMNIKGVRTTDGFCLEVAVPLKNRLFTLNPFDGRPFGLNISYNDNDNGVKREHKVTWSKFDNNDSSWGNPSVFGVAVFASDIEMPILMDTRPEGENTEDRVIVNNSPGYINLLVNGDFQQGDKGWHAWNESAKSEIGIDFYVDQNQTINGKKSFCIDATKLAGLSTVGRLMSNCFNVIPGEKYRLAFYVRTSSTTPVSITSKAKTPSYFINTIGGLQLSASDGWQRKEFDFVIPNNWVEEDNVAQIFFLCDGFAGEKIWFSDVKLVRYTPGSADANLYIDKPVYAFAGDEAKTAHVLLYNNGQVPSDLKIQYNVRDFYYQKDVYTQTIDVTIPSGNSTDVPIIFPITDNGNFKVRMTIEDIHSGWKIYRETDFSIYVKPDSAAQIMQYNAASMIYLKDSAEVLAETFSSMKVTSVRSFVYPSLFEVQPGSGIYDFSRIDLLVDALAKYNITLLPVIQVRDTKEMKMITDLDAFYTQTSTLVSHFRGRIPIYEIGNEVNLIDSDYRKYEAILRVAYNAVKQNDSEARVSTAGFAWAKTAGYVGDFINLDKGNFYDVFSFHYYDFLTSGSYKEAIKALVNMVGKYQNNPIIFDTESGLVLATGGSYEEGLELLAKKIPFLLNYSIARHYEFEGYMMGGGYVFSYYSSTSSGFAQSCFQSKMYAGAASEGRIDFSPDYVGYLFSKQANHFCVVWKNEDSYVQGVPVNVPVIEGYKVYDIFGNDVTNQYPVANGEISVVLKDRMPVYVDGIDVGRAPAAVRFVTEGGGSEITPYEKEVLILPEDLNSFFTQSLIKGQEKSIPLYVQNFGKTPQTVNISVIAQDSNIKAVTSVESVMLAPGEKMDFNVILNATGDASNSNVTVTGTLGNEALAPMTFDVKVQEALSIQPQSRYIVFKNNTENSLSGTAYLTSGLQDVTPTSIAVDGLKSGETRIYSYDVTSKTYGAAEKSGNADVNIHFVENSHQIEDIQKQFKSAFFIAGKLNSNINVNDRSLFEDLSSKLPVMTFSDGKTDGITADIMLGYTQQKLAIVARVSDAEHYQASDGGYISGGDCIIIGVDPNDDSRTPGQGYRNDDFECGLALRNDGRIVCYRWDGQNGPESAKPFTEAATAVYRDGNNTYYIALIPVSVDLTTKKQIGMSLLVNNYSKDGKKSDVPFGDGIEGLRDASLFGRIVLVEDPLPPVTIAQIAGNKTGDWYTSGVTVALSASDKGSGVAKTEYSLDEGATWNTYSTPVIFNEDGRNIFSFRSVDNAENMETAKSVSLNIDTTSPVITVNMPASTDYNDSSDLTTQFAITDAISGVDSAKTTAMLDDQSMPSGTRVPLYTLTLGTHVYTVTAYDMAGNISTVSVNFRAMTSIDFLKALVTRFENNGWIDNKGIAVSLQAKLEIIDLIDSLKIPEGKNTIDKETANKFMKKVKQGNLDKVLKPFGIDVEKNKWFGNAGLTSSLKDKLKKLLLNAFINEVQAQSGKHITAEAAGYLIRDAQALLEMEEYLT